VKDPKQPITRVKNGVICWGFMDYAEPIGAEGIDWIKGRHAADSEDAQAMLAAWKLARSSQAMDLQVADDLYVRGKMTETA
jgi:hypothetical protein